MISAPGPDPQNNFGSTGSDKQTNEMELIQEQLQELKEEGMGREREKQLANNREMDSSMEGKKWLVEGREKFSRKERRG